MQRWRGYGGGVVHCSNACDEGVVSRQAYTATEESEHLHMAERKEEKERKERKDACVRARACVRVIAKDQVVRGTHTVGALDVVVFQMLEQFLLSCRNKSATIALEMVILPHVGRHCLSI